MEPTAADGETVLRPRRTAFRDPDARLELLECGEVVELLLGRTERAWSAHELIDLARSTPSELARGIGLGRRGALRLAAAFELARRMAAARGRERPSVTSAADVHALCGAEFRGLEREQFVVLVLDGKHRLRCRELVSSGSLTSSIVHPREVFRPALRLAAAAVICAHNHPSGDPEPSPEDLEVTRRLLQAGRLLGVPLLDHVVIGDQRFVSLRERMAF